MKFRIITILFFIVVFYSCDKSNVTPEPEPSFFNSPGVFVVNEGNFTAGNASLTWIGFNSDTLIPDAFYAVNKVPLGDVANYMTIHNDRGYIVVNNAGLVYVINIKDGTFLGKISGLTSPREILIVDENRALISSLSDKYLTVINPSAFEITGKIDLNGRSSESLLRIGKKIYVANWSKLNQQKSNNVVLVVDVDQMALVDSIQVTKEPNSMVVDNNEKLWVLCSGGYNNTEIPVLYRINPSDNSVEKRFEFSDKNSNPFSLNINGTGEQLYFLNEAVFRMDIEDVQLATQPFIEKGENNFYALGVRPDIEELFVSDVLDYVRNGKVLVYNQSGSFKHKFEAGIIPGYFCFYH